jgi:hypothetical protein
MANQLQTPDIRYQFKPTLQKVAVWGQLTLKKPRTKEEIKTKTKTREKGEVLKLKHETKNQNKKSISAHRS